MRIFVGEFSTIQTMELRKHTSQEFEQMSEEDYCCYEEKLVDLANGIGLQRNTIEDLEASLLNIKELAQNKGKKRGHSYSQGSKGEKNCVSRILNSIEKCKANVIKELTNYVGDGQLTLSKAIKFVDNYGDSFKIKCIYKERLYDVYDECEYSDALHCAEFVGDENSVGLHQLPLDVLLKICQKIVDNNALLLTDEEFIAEHVNPDDIA